MLNIRKQDLPMLATYSRIAATIPLVLLLIQKDFTMDVLAAVVFCLASLTDWLDGYWARIFNAESAMGKFMDPIADKLLVLGPFVMLLHLGKIDPYMVIIFLGRDIYIGGLRSVAAANNVIIAAKPFGKWKTAIQMVAIPCLIIGDFWGLPIALAGYGALWFSVGLSVISGVQYAYGYYQHRQKI